MDDGMTVSPLRLLVAALVLVTVTGCKLTADPELEAYLTVAESLSGKVVEAWLRESPEGANLCFSSRFFFQDEVFLPQTLQAELREADWDLYNPELPPDGTTYLVFLSERQGKGKDWIVSGGYQVFEVLEDEVDAWGDDWEFRIRCFGGYCRVRETPAKTHSDFASVPTDEFLATEKGKCSGSFRSRIALDEVAPRLW